MAKLKKPEVPKSFFYGNIVSWKFRDTITFDHGTYCIRFKLFFESGDTCNKQVGGFKSEKLAIQAKEKIIAALVKKEYIPFKYTVEEYMNFWLYYYMVDEKKISYNTFFTYRNVLYNYLIHSLKGKIGDISIDDLTNALRSINKKSVQKSAIGVVYSLFKYAFNNNIISFNPSFAAVKIIRTEIKTTSLKIQRPVYNLEQVKLLLYTCRKNYPVMYMPLLLCLTTGIRISECAGVKYSDIDFSDFWLHIDRQIGWELDKDGLQEKNTKSKKGVRDMPLPKFVIDEIIIRRKHYEELKSKNPNFKDSNYICCKENGSPYYSKELKKDYDSLIKDCGLHKITWHDLRHTYATTLKNKVNLKAISMFLGHVRPEFSLDTYIYKEPDIVYDCCKYLEKIWEQVKPPETENMNNAFFEFKISPNILEYILPNMSDNVT